MSEAEFDQAVARIRQSRRYRGVAPALIRRVVELEARKHSGRELIKAAQRHLHRIYGAYLPTPPRYARLLEELDAARQAGDAALREALTRIMSMHASTRERVPALEPLMRELNARLGAVGTVLDLACGLQPLAAPWWDSLDRMIAMDIDEPMLEFIDRALELLELPHEVGFVDLHADAELPAADVALLLKTLPCLSPDLSRSVPELLARIPAPVKVVSFPTRSLGGRQKGMRANYGQMFEAELEQIAGTWECFEVPGELVYIVDARPGDPAKSLQR